LVTISGKSLVSRMGGSILKHAKLESTICDSTSEYMEKIYILSKKSAVNYIVDKEGYRPISESLASGLILVCNKFV
jgi:predicted O-linked N-acetylglucosamine transferase (SPINDLY family)